MNQNETVQKKRSRTTDEVQAFYDSSPYPPPITQLDDYRQTWEEPNRRRADFHLYWPDRPYQEIQTILVAGCGTSQAAKHAVRHPAAQILGIDVSEGSLKQTEALKNKYELDNLKLRQLAVEQVGELDQKFDKIICTGVLHHLADPLVGLRELGKVLKLEGAMQLMVYAAYGRTGIYMLQDYCRRLGITATETEVNELANTLMSLSENHPLAPLLGQSPDFRTRAGLADALLNPQDRAFTVPQFLEFIEQSGLEFDRWVRQAPYLPSCGAIADTPHGARLCNLPAQEQYAAMELFRGTMVCHSATVIHGDYLSKRQRVQFDDQRWLEFVPILLPRTICVREKLPPGAAAVLINQAHTDRDLYLPITSAEKKLYDGIDGKRSIRDIIRWSDIEFVGAKAESSVGQFFQRMWEFDQVVFNASNTGKT